MSFQAADAPSKAQLSFPEQESLMDATMMMLSVIETDRDSYQSHKRGTPVRVRLFSLEGLNKFQDN